MLHETARKPCHRLRVNPPRASLNLTSRIYQHAHARYIGQAAGSLPLALDISRTVSHAFMYLMGYRTFGGTAFYACALVHDVGSSILTVSSFQPAIAS